MHGFTFAAVPGFLVVFLRDDNGLSDGLILRLAAGQTVGLLLMSVLLGRLSDWSGSRPVMRIAISGYMIVLLFLSLGAMGIIGISVAGFSVLFILIGLFEGAHTISQMRLAMACCPEEELTISMAFYQVCVAVSRGTSSLLWGLTLTALRDAYTAPFKVFFVTILILGIAVQLFLTRIGEPKAFRTREVLYMLLWAWPIRFFITTPRSKEHGRKGP
jgi:MFS family permease